MPMDRGSSIEYLEDHRIPMPWREVELELVIHELVMQNCWGSNAAGWTRYDVKYDEIACLVSKPVFVVAS